jgi:putative adhesin
MRATKIGLLLLILAFGSTVETAWRVRNHLGPGGWGWFMNGGRFSGPSFSFTAEERVAVAPTTTEVELENAFGSATVTQGAPGEVRISLRKVVFLSTEDKARAYADRILVQSRPEGAALRLSTNRLELEQATGNDGAVGFETHFEISVPPGTAVHITNEHGPVRVADVARATISASHDSVTVERVGGPVEIDARHGDVRASSIKGDVKITSAHGDVTVADVTGRASLDVQHGEVTAARVGGLVVNGAHGDITAETVQGDLEIHSQHAAVRGTGITGRASVETSFQGITLEKVGGDAAVHTEHGDVNLTDITGAVEAKASFNDVSLTRIGGLATVTVSHGAVRAAGLEKGAHVRATGDEVVLEGFHGPIDVEAERGAVRLVPAGAIEAPVKVTATHGGIELEVPAGSRFDLDASAAPGEITSDVSGITMTQTGMGKLTGVVGGGGNAVVLVAQHGDVRLRSAATVAQKTN